MKLSRRGFIAAAPAAAVAAPAVATKIVAEMGGERLYGGYAGGGLADSKYIATTKDCLVASENWAEEHIKQLISQRTRLKSDCETLGGSIRYVEAQRIDGLRSVSPVSKARMVAESEKRRALADELKWLDQRIADIKNDHPVLAYLAEAMT